MAGQQQQNPPQGAPADYGSYPQNAMNLGGPVYPWLQPYGGQFAAPMSPWETGALGGYSNFVGGGAGTGPASQYYQNVLGGQYLSPNTNPWLKQIQTSGQSIKDYQDSEAIRRIQSAMAAGGNALSGATGSAMGNYLNQSGANFENIMGNLMSNLYQGERGLQQGAAQGSLGAAGQYGNSLMNMMNMGAVPRGIQQADLQGQYQDFLRQIGGYQQAFNYPQQLALQEQSHGYPGYAPPNYGTSQAAGWAALLPQLFGMGGAGGGGALSGLLNSLGNLFGGGTGSGSDPNATANLDLFNQLNSGDYANPTDYGNLDLYNMLNSGGPDPWAGMDWSQLYSQLNSGGQLPTEGG